MFGTLRPHGLQHARLPCPSPSWSLLELMYIELVMPSNHLIRCHPLLLLPQSFLTSGAFPMSQSFLWGSQSIGASASAAVLSVNTVNKYWQIGTCRDHCQWLNNKGICHLPLWRLRAYLVAQRLKRVPPMQETWVQSLGQEDPLEKEMVTHSSILAWRIPWMEEPGRLQSMGSQRVGHDWVTSLALWRLNPALLQLLTFNTPWESSG